ncbi:hypothetical protein H9X94_00845 [Micromonospora aurantiaca]|nr:hypothetical protein [Micromonospora aurantiaca]
MLSTRARYQVVAPLLTPLGYARYAVKLWRAEDHPRDPRTGRFIPKPGGPKRPRRPSARNHVASTRAWEAAQRARQALPADEAGWRSAVRKEIRPAERAVDRRVAELEAELAAVRDTLAKRRAELADEFRRKRTPKSKREQIANDRLADEIRDVAMAESQLAWMRGIAENPEELAKPSNRGLGNMLAAQVEMVYPKDPVGRVLPPEEYHKALDQVLEAGKALHDDFLDAKRRDKEYNDLQRKLDGELGPEAIRKAFAAQDPGRHDLMARRNAAQKAQTRREHELLKQLLASVRPFGGVRHKAAPAGESSRRVYGAEAARPDWEARLREAEAYFPDDWLSLSAKAELRIASSQRAFHAGGRGHDSSLLAMPVTARDQDVYIGAFRDYTHEVNVHEMGHRMEMMVPGLQELEFTFVRRRSMRGSSLEPLARLKDIVRHSGYDEREVAFPDDWRNPYAGKSYEQIGRVNGRPFVQDPDPGARPWEVFQVGLQDTFGRNPRFGDDELQHFTLGVLATLARTETTKPKRKRRSR